MRGSKNGGEWWNSRLILMLTSGLEMNFIEMVRFREDFVDIISSSS